MKNKPFNIIYGVGVNDTKNQTFFIDKNGNTLKCKYYSVWSDMLKRCYSEKVHKRQPTYKDCTVCDEWLAFSNFRSWMEKQDWKGKCLDKDIVKEGNKVYGPDVCVFVPSSLNNLFTNNEAIRGKYPIGVCFDKRNNRFTSQCTVDGKQKHLGRFDTPEEAAKAYIVCKVNRVRVIAEGYRHDERIYNGLIAYCDKRIKEVNSRAAGNNER